MDAVKKAKYRMAQLPGLLEACKAEAAAYASCVIRCDDVKKYDCQKEFTHFLECARVNAAKMKIRFV